MTLKLNFVYGGYKSQPGSDDAKQKKATQIE